MPPSNPFRPAEQVAPRIKAFIFGVSGVGKTYLALTSPGKIAAIDTEGGMAFYARRAGKGGLSEFEILQTKTYRDVKAAVQFIAANPKAYATLVIDPLTVIYETLQDAAQLKRAGKRNDPDADLEMLDWQRIKRSYKALMTELVNLPVHVIVIAREKDETERKGDQTIKVGVKADAEKGTAYFFDTVIRLVPTDEGREAIVLKDRTGTHQLNARIADPSFDRLWGSTLKAGRKDTGARDVQDDIAAAEIDAAETFASPPSAEAIPAQVAPTAAGNGHASSEAPAAQAEPLSAPVEAPVDPGPADSPAPASGEPDALTMDAFHTLLKEQGVSPGRVIEAAQELYGRRSGFNDQERAVLWSALRPQAKQPVTTA